MNFSTTSLRYRTEDLAFAAAGLLLNALPIETASWLSGALWKMIGPNVSRRHERALANLALAYPEKTPAERAAIAAGMWENLGRTFAECFRLDEIAESDRVAVERPEDFTFDEGRGHVVCAAHQGNWEIAVLAISGRTATRPAGVYQRIKNPRVDARVRRMRAFLYPGGLFPKHPATPRQLIRHAREGGTLAMLADQRDLRGARVMFFGRPAPSTPFPATVARSLGLRLYAGQIIRAPNVRFSIRLVEIPVPQTSDREADILTATAALHAEFERSIRLHPEQWLWSHRRWG